MFKFTNITSNRGLKPAPDLMDHAVLLFLNNRSVLLDDYFKPDSDSIIDYIDSLYPHFWVVTTLDESQEFVGFVYLDGWKGASDNLHSCFISGAAVKKFWGTPVFLAALAFMDYSIKAYKLKKIKAEVFSHNRLVKNFLKKLGFELEARLGFESVKDSKPLDILIYSYFTHNTKELSYGKIK